MKLPPGLRWAHTGQTLGEGGQAQVQLVSDKTGQLSGLWALKALKRNQAGQAYDRFSREVAAIQTLCHPSIIQIVDHSNSADDFQYYVMEYIEGARTLDKVLFHQANPFHGDALKTLCFFEQICNALHACESCKPAVVHRDLSPANILLCPGDRPKIIDFGLCQIEGHKTITLVDEGVGTINYMAPECESGATGDATVGSDLYSAGKILWSTITGLRAFSRENPVYTSKSMTEVFPDKPETWHLHHIFEKTIRRAREDRWNSAEEAVAEARRISYLIRSGYPPLEEIAKKCPICGVGTLDKFEGSHMVFGNPNPKGIAPVQCSYCGYCFAVSYENQRRMLGGRTKLE